MWQMNRNVEFGSDSQDDFALKGTQVQLKLHKRGEFLVQAALTFTMKGGYLSKALNRRKGMFIFGIILYLLFNTHIFLIYRKSARTVDKSALEPLSVTEILQVQAGCHGYDQNLLPSSSRRSKKGENKHSSQFITLKASPTPIASNRLYFLKFKSRGTRNDLLFGLRGLLAELQVNEGVSISSILTPQVKNGNRSGSPIRSRPGEDKRMEECPGLPPNADTITVPLPEVHKVIDAERHAYDRLLLMMLQGASDLKSSEDDMLALRGTLDDVMSESKEKDKIQTNDSKLIMQLSKKLETLLMDNEDLRDQNENLNNRIVTLEHEKLGVYES